MCNNTIDAQHSPLTDTLVPRLPPRPVSWMPSTRSTSSTRQNPHRRKLCAHRLPWPRPPSAPQHTQTCKAGVTWVGNVALLSPSPPTELLESAVDARLSSPANIDRRRAMPAAPSVLRSGAAGGDGPIAGSGVPTLSSLCLRVSPAVFEGTLSWLMFNPIMPVWFRCLTTAVAGAETGVSDMQTLFLRGLPPFPPPRSRPCLAWNSSKVGRLQERVIKGQGRERERIANARLKTRGNQRTIYCAKHKLG